MLSRVEHEKSFISSGPGYTWLIALSAKGNNFSDFLFALLYVSPFLERALL